MHLHRFLLSWIIPFSTPKLFAPFSSFLQLLFITGHFDNFPGANSEIGCILSNSSNIPSKESKCYIFLSNFFHGCKARQSTSITPGI